ncbi:MAG TPA: hypothetical protein DEV93_01240 [Chloroflexi bacterium]|jgi:hypothetical protein|nr:hypothetical protein [Chloroflexota bacterium]
MKLLLDSAFPRAAADRGHSGVALERWDRGERTDEELLLSARAGGFDGVVFLGHSAAARKEIVELLKRDPVIAVVTNSDVPTQATRHLETALRALKDSARPGQMWLVLATGPRRIHPAPEV